MSKKLGRTIILQSPKCKQKLIETISVIQQKGPLINYLSKQSLTKKHFFFLYQATENTLSLE